MKCHTCRKEILKRIEPSKIKRNRHHFCSRTCYVIHWAKERTGPKSHKWNKSIPVIRCRVCHKEFRVKTRYGKPQVHCSRKCRAVTQAERFRGGNNPRWRGGTTDIGTQIRHSEKYITWRNACGKRDKFKCQFCNASHHKRLVVHHIKTFEKFPNLRFEISNGITLCRGCHIKLHRQNKGVHDFTKILNDYMPNMSQKL